MKDPAEDKLESELITEIARGDRGSFSDLYDRYSTVLYSIAYQVLNNNDDAQDVLQDVFVMIWEKAGLFNPQRGRPITWAITLTRNKAIDRLRSKKRRFRLQDEVRSETEVEEQTLSPDSAFEVDLLERSQIVRQAIERLSEPERVAIEMAFFKGMTQGEVAEELDEPLGTVKARIRRGMMKLREMVKSKL